MHPARALALLALTVALILPSTTGVAFGAPLSQGLSGTATGLAVSSAGNVVVIGTTDGVYGFTPAGSQLFHTLAGTSIGAVAVDRSGDLVVAGDGNGLVHILHADGSDRALGVTIGGITVASTSDDGSVIAVGTSQGYLSSFNPGIALPAPLPALPVNPLNILLPQWTYGLGSAVSFVSVTADGQWVDAANSGAGPAGRAWLFGGDSELLPGGLVSLPFFGDLPPCGVLPFVKCWIYQQYTPGASVTALSAAHSNYNMIISYSSGWTIGTSASSYFANPWNHHADGAPTSAQMSADGSRVLVGDSFGNVYGIVGIGGFSGTVITEHWRAQLATKVARTAISGNGGVNAAADTTGAITLFNADGLVLGTASAGGALSSLALTPDGSKLVGTTGSTALFWS